MLTGFPACSTMEYKARRLGFALSWTTAYDRMLVSSLCDARTVDPMAPLWGAVQAFRLTGTRDTAAALPSRRRGAEGRRDAPYHHAPAMSRHHAQGHDLCPYEQQYYEGRARTRRGGAAPARRKSLHVPRAALLHDTRRGLHGGGDHIDA